jgi:ribosome-associated translation inhibitor RaiA
MQVAIRSHGFPLTTAIESYVQRRLHTALSHAIHHIRAVTVVLLDINGPRGGRDKVCRVRVTVKDRPVMVIDNTEDNLYVAIDRAADRAGRTTARKLAQLLRKPRSMQRRVDTARQADVPDAGDDASADNAHVEGVR